MSSRKTTICLLIVTTCALFLGACGKNGGVKNWLKSVNLSSEEVNNDNFVTVSARLDTQNITMPSINLPLTNPNDPSQEWGRVAIVPTMGTSLSDIVVTVNITQISGQSTCPLGAGKLPNNLDIPVATDATKLICLAIDGSKALVYLMLDINANKLMIGTAIPIQEFDTLKDKLPNVNTFTQFKFTSISGAFGIFTGIADGQNGAAIFVDASDALSAAPGRLQFQTKLELQNLQVIGQELKKLNDQGATLHAY